MKRAKQLELDFEVSTSCDQDDNEWLRREKSLDKWMAEWMKRKNTRKKSDGSAVSLEFGHAARGSK